MSFFKKGADSSSLPHQVEASVRALLDSAYDGDVSVRTEVANALGSLAQNQSNLVVNTTTNFLATKKISHEHRVTVWGILGNIASAQLENLGEEAVTGMVMLGIREMTASRDIIPDLQGAAENVAVIAAKKQSVLFMEEMVKGYSSGIPHYFIIKAVADFAAELVIPRLKEILAKTLPILNSLKHDNLRWIFALSLGKFCEAIREYAATAGPQSSEVFADDVFIAFQVLLEQWITRSDPKLRAVSVQALGACIPVMPKERFESQLGKCLPVVLNMARKEEGDRIFAMQALCAILEQAAHSCPNALDIHMQLLLRELHAAAMAVPSGDQTAQLKVYQELLRCWEALGRASVDQVLGFVVARLDQPPLRLGTLQILRHLCARLDDIMETRRMLVISGLKPVLSDPSPKVQESLNHIAVVLARLGYLQLEGGLDVVRVIVNALATPIPPTAPGQKPSDQAVFAQSLRELGDRTLDVITTTIPAMHDVLWPHALMYIVPPELTAALPCVCKTIAFVAQQKMESESPDYVIDFDRLVNIPKPAALMARLFVTLSQPSRNQVGGKVIDCMRTIAPNLHPAVSELWSEALPRLTSFLVGTQFTQTLWEDVLLRMLAQTLATIADDDWIGGLAQAFADQTNFYKGDAPLKSALLRYLGVALQRCHQIEFSKKMIDHMFANTNHNDETERLGLAQGLGYAAATHLDNVIARLQLAVKNEMQQKATGFLAGIMNSEPTELPNVKASIILSFGYVTARADKKLVTSRLESTIMTTMTTLIATAKDRVVKDAIIRALDVIGKTIHPTNLGTPYNFRFRDQLLERLVTLVVPTAPSDGSDLRVKALNACSTFVGLPPNCPWAVSSKAIEKLTIFYNLPAAAPVAPVQGQKPTEAKKTPVVIINEEPKPDSEKKDEEELTFNAFNELLATMLAAEPTVDMVCKLLKSIDSFATSSNPVARERATRSMQHILHAFLEFKSTDQGDASDRFTALAPWFSALVTRATDSVASIREVALEAITELLMINRLLAQHNGEFDAALARLEDIKPLAEEGADEKVLFKLASELAGILCVLILPDDLPAVLERLLTGLSDIDHYAAAGACLVVNGLFRRRGAELEKGVEGLVPHMLSAAAQAREHTANGALHALRTLARHHCTGVVDALLSTPIPPAAHVVKSLQTIVKDSELGSTVVAHVCDAMVNAQLFDEKPNPAGKGVIRSPAALPNAATCALEALMNGAPEELVNEHFAQVLGSIVLRLGTANEAGADGPAHAVDALAALAKAGKDTKATETVAECKKELETQIGYPKGLAKVIANICEMRPECIQAVYDFLFPYLSRAYAGYRIAATATISEFITHSSNNRDLLYALVNALLARLGDEAVACRTQAYAGLGNLANARGEVGRYAAPAMSALIAGLDDAVEDVSLQAFSSLFRIVEVVDENSVSPVLVNLCMRLKPAYARTNAAIRGAAFELFGALSRFGGGMGSTSFYEQLHVAFMPLLLHCNDEVPEVRASCKRALRRASQMLRSDDVVELLSRRMFDDDVKLDYDQFLDQLCPLLVISFRDRVNYYLMTAIEYYKSPWHGIRANAANFSGRLLSHLSPSDRRNVNTDQSCVALVTLLKEPSPAVRKRAAHALSLLHNY